jgi:hypothetical protein
MGEYIDSCHIIIRLNGYVTEGHEKYVGSKTTIWCYNAAPWNLLKPPAGSIKAIWAIRRGRHRISQRDTTMAKLLKAHLWQVPGRWINDLRRESTYTTPSTGLIALYAAIRTYGHARPIYTQGMGQLTLGKQLHYYQERKIKKQLRHSGEIEAKLIREWVKNGTVRVGQ